MTEIKKISFKEQIAATGTCGMEALKVNTNELPNDALKRCQVGAEVLKAAVTTVENGERVIDQEIASLSAQINEKLAKEASFTEIDQLVRQLVCLIARKAGINNLELSQLEVEEMRREIQKIKKTYNSPLQLALSIGCGAISVIGGVVGLGAAGAGIGSLVTGVESVGKIAGFVGNAGSALDGVSKGVMMGAETPIRSHYESNRSLLQFFLEEERRRRGVSDQNVNQERQDGQTTKHNISQQESERHSAIIALFRSFAGG